MYGPNGFSGQSTCATHQNDLPCSTPIKGHTNARFLPLFRTPFFSVQNTQIRVLKTHFTIFFKFLFCVFRTPKKGVFETTQKENFRCWVFKSAFKALFTTQHIFFISPLI